MLIVLIFYTVLIICSKCILVVCTTASNLCSVNLVGNLDTNLMLPGDEAHLTPESIKSRIRGSKLVLVVEQSMCVTIWGCKICLLLMYNKLTFGLKQHLAVKIVAAYVVLNFIVMEGLYLGYWCRPLSNYWSVPVANSEYYIHEDLVAQCTNRSSSMLGCGQSPHYQCCLQHIFGYHDALHTTTITDYIPTTKNQVCVPVPSKRCK